MHKIDDDTLVTADLLRRFIRIAEADGGDGRHYAMIQKEDGSWLDHNPHSPELEPMQAVFGRDIVSMLNKDLHHDGVWLIVFSHPGFQRSMLETSNEYSRFNLMWLDKDGDTHLRLEWEAGETDELEFADVLLSGKESWGERAESAYQQMVILNRQVLAMKEGQTYKRARGERPRQ